MVNVIRLASIHLDHTNVAATVALLLQTMGSHVMMFINVQQTMAVVHVIRLAWIYLDHLDHTNVAATMAMFLQAMGGHVTMLMNVLQMWVLVIVSKIARIHLDHFTAVVTLVTQSLD